MTTPEQKTVMMKALRRATRLRKKAVGRDPQNLAQVKLALIDMQNQLDDLTKVLRFVVGVTDADDEVDTGE